MQPEQMIPHRRQGFDIWLGIWRLRSHVNVQPGEVDLVWTLKGLSHHLAGVRGRDSELRGVKRRLQTGVRARADSGDQADRHIGALAGFRRDPLDQFQLERRIDVDRVYAGVNRFGELALGLRNSVHLDLVGPETGAQRAKQFAAGIDLDIDAGFAHDAQHSKQVVGLRRIAEFDLFVMARGFEQSGYVMPNARGRDDEQRRVELFSESDGVDSVYVKMVVADLEVTGNSPGWLDWLRR